MNSRSRATCYCAASLVLAGLSMNASVRAAASPAAESAFGLTPGTRWTYTRTAGDGRPETIQEKVVALKTVKGHPVAEIQVSSNGSVRYEYLAARPDGLWTYMPLYLGNWAGVNDQWPPTPTFKAGLKKGDSWSWTEIQAVQTAGSKKYDPEDFRLNTTAVVEAVDEPITTPAGTFKVTVVKYDAVSKTFGKRSFRRWISPEAGLVREELLSAKGRIVTELQSYRPGPASPRS